MNTRELKNWKRKLDRLQAEDKPFDVIALARLVLQSNRTDLNVLSIASAFLIDAGSTSNDINAIQEGMALVKELLAKPCDNERHTIAWQYNLSNAHGAAAKIYFESENLESSREALQEQKDLLQEILPRAQHADRALLSSIHTNYANVLDRLNRTIEAIDHYAMAWSLDQHHMVAKGNCGEALRQLTLFTPIHQRENIEAFLVLLEEACSAPRDIVARASTETVANLKRNLAALKESIEKVCEGGLESFRRWILHRHTDHGDPEAPKWLSRIVADRLLLNFNQFPLPSIEEAVDDVFFARLGFGREEKSEEWSLKLIYLFNVIKEEFVTARYMYYRSSDRPKELMSADRVTTYANPERFTEFSLSSGLLKAGMRGAVDVLDKIAHFLDIYLRLGNKERCVNFNVIWFKECDVKKGEHPIIAALRQSNPWLESLKNLQTDWFTARYPGPFKKLRDTITHRGLILRSPLVEQTEQTISYRPIDDLSAETILMLRTARAAILYLVLLVDSEEARMARGNDKVRLEQTLTVQRNPK